MEQIAPISANAENTDDFIDCVDSHIFSRIIEHIGPKIAIMIALDARYVIVPYALS